MGEGMVRSFVRDLFASKYNAKAHDPKSQRIDGGAHCYPNCHSDVWLRSCEREVLEPISGVQTGAIPTWLCGSLLRNGPGSWKVGDQMFQHLFDCSALLHRFAIHNGKVTYQNRFVATETRKKNMAAQRIVVTEFGTASVPDPCHSIFDKVSALFRPDGGSDNSMISVYPFGDEYYTFTETPVMHRINPRTLATEGRVCLTDYAGIINHTSHPHVMEDGSVFNLGMATTRSGPAYNIICFPNGDRMLEDAHIVGTVPCRWKLHPGYMHTFGITSNFFVVVEQPLSVSLTEFVRAQLSNEKLCACLKWYEDEPTLIHLISRQSGRVTHTYHAEAFFYLHIVNQYEEDDHVIIDICGYKNPEMINAMYLEAITNMQTNADYARLFRGRPIRFVLPLSAGIVDDQKGRHKKPTNVTATGKTENRHTSVRRSSLIKSLSLSGLSVRMHRPKMTHSLSQHEHTTHSTGLSRSRGSINDLQEDTDPPWDEPNLVSLHDTLAQAFRQTDGRVLVRPEQLCDLGCETPRINYERHLGRKYRYFYAISSDVDADNPGTLIKVDLATKTRRLWCEDHCYPSEPIFVPSPGAQAEDDGVVLASLVWGGGLADNKVGLLVLCARSWTELGRAEFHTDGPVPKCLHGWFAEHIV